MDPAAQNEMEMRRELQRMNAAIERYAAQLDSIDGQLVIIEDDNENDEVNRQIKEYEATMSKQNKKDIAAEDALDNIVRLQNQLKIVRRRNQLLGRENNVQKKQVNDRANLLKKMSDEVETVCDATGWSGEFEDVDYDEVNEYKANTHDMLMREQEVRRDIKSAKLIVKKKEDAILALTRQIDFQKERQAHFNKMNNDIRVKQREVREIDLKVQRMNTQDTGIDRALVEVEDRDTMVMTSVSAMETDKEYLTEAVIETRMNCRRQDNVIKAQLARQQQLQKRLESIMKSMGEMKLEKEFERNVAKSALVPSASREEPEDVSQILPEHESIRIDTYRLLYKNNEMMRTNVARKNMLVLEKESVIQAMDAKLGGYVDSHNINAANDDSLRGTKKAQVNEMLHELQRTHDGYNTNIDQLKNENRELRASLSTAMTNAKRTTAARRTSATAGTPAGSATSSKRRVR